MTANRSKTNTIRLSDAVGGGYGTFWRFRGRYRVVKGSRASKKSKTTALWFIFNMMSHPGANALVIRKTYRTLKDSCFTELKWAIHRLNVDALWSMKEVPLEMTYKPTGQKIYFRGLDDPLKIASVTVENGVLCWGWIEEAYEVSKESDFDLLDESIRGSIPSEYPGLWKMWTLTFNPWSDRSRIKHRFFDEIIGKDESGKPIYRERKNPISEDGSILAMTTDYRCNEWLDDSDRKLFEDMKIRNPRRYQVAGLGNWGVVEGLIYEHWREWAFTTKDLPAGYVTVCGLDFGYTNDPTAAVIAFYSKATRQLFIWDELYKKGLTNRMIYEELCRMGYGDLRFVADSAEPKSIAELHEYGLRIYPAQKGKDSILNGIQFVQDLEIIVHPRCVNYLTELSLYTWETDRSGTMTNNPVDDNNHLMDATRYALSPYMPHGGFRYHPVTGGI